MEIQGKYVFITVLAIMIMVYMLVEAYKKISNLESDNGVGRDSQSFVTRTINDANNRGKLKGVFSNDPDLHFAKMDYNKNDGNDVEDEI